MLKNTVKHILGYIIGGFLFLFLLPYGLFCASRSFDRLINIQLIPSFTVRNIISVILLVAGLFFALWSIIIQNIIGKGGPLEASGIEVSPKTQKLVVTGPYKYTRNPMLFGACVLYYAVAIYLNSIVALAIAALFMTFMLIFVKLTEERRLIKDFGIEYEEYRRRVSMFIPWPKKPKCKK